MCKGLELGNTYLGRIFSSSIIKVDGSGHMAGAL